MSSKVVSVGAFFEEEKSDCSYSKTTNSRIIISFSDDDVVDVWDVKKPRVPYFFFPETTVLFLNLIFCNPNQSEATITYELQSTPSPHFFAPRFGLQHKILTPKMSICKFQDMYFQVLMLWGKKDNLFSQPLKQSPVWGIQKKGSHFFLLSKNSWYQLCTFFKGGRFSIILLTLQKVPHNCWKKWCLVFSKMESCLTVRKECITRKRNYSSKRNILN